MLLKMLLLFKFQDDNITDTERKSFFMQFVDILLKTHEKYIPLSIDVVVPILQRRGAILSDQLLRRKIMRGKK